ncbi:MAG: hypothetical protein ACXAAH_12910 [Promethearchaeota archaeon]
MSYLPIKKEAENDLITIADIIVEDINDIWNYYRINSYSLTPEETSDFHLKLKAHQRRLNEYIEKYSIIKQCSRCKREFPATSNFFYKDRRVKDGLRPDCIACHRTLQRKKYVRKVKQYT